MLIIPMTGRLNWRNPPWITLFLILANCFIYFAFLSPELRKTQEYMEFYFTSGLGEIETVHYLEYVNEPQKGKKVTPDVIADTYNRMIGDADFMRKLDNDQIISAGSPIYVKWKGLREVFLKK